MNMVIAIIAKQLLHEILMNLTGGWLIKPNKAKHYRFARTHFVRPCLRRYVRFNSILRRV
jgi:hypothetical protein